MLLHYVVPLYIIDDLSPFVPTAEHPVVQDEACSFFTFFYHMKSFRFFGRIGPTRETMEERDDVRESREGERTAVPGGNRQVVSRQLVSCGGENSKKGLRGHCARATVIDVAFRESY